MGGIAKKIKLVKKYIKKKDPCLGKRIIRGIYENSLRTGYKLSKPKGIKILDQKWDFLIILDACRYDSFKKFNTIKGKLEKKISLGSNTLNWIKENFDNTDKSCKDIIYITSNPYMSGPIMKNIFSKEKFFKVEPVWDYGWDFKLNTVSAKEVTRASLKLIAQHPRKRMIIHYMQPHAPYISPKTKDPKLTRRAKVIEEAVYFGNLDVEKVKTAYHENLKYVLKDIKDNLLPYLKGRIVITADHGEAFGEKWLFFHPESIYIKELVEVPWLVVNKKSAKKIRKDKKPASRRKTESKRKEIRKLNKAVNNLKI